MKQRIYLVLVSLCMLTNFIVPVYAVDTNMQNYQAVYLGVENYGLLNRDNMSSFRHRFCINGQIYSTYTISDNGGAYTIQNKLQEGYVYDITVQNGNVIAADSASSVAEGSITSVDSTAITVAGQSISLDGSSVYQITNAAGGSTVIAASTADLQVGKTVKVYENNGQYVIYLTFVANQYTAPVSGTPGLKTLKNFLVTAMEPVGTTLYVYGGAWDWQDTASSNQATTIGLPQSWVDFFQSQNANYNYKNPVQANSYYPFDRWNQYYYAGADCSGYVGWAVYNTMNTQSSGTGYVFKSTAVAQQFANLGWGTKTQNIQRYGFKPGDIMSMNGHVWICLGTCDDGSVVILHSTPSKSVNGQSGGGVQINGIGDSENCQAVQLARTYMSRYFPTWYSRYHNVYKNYASYTSFSGNTAGKFSWTINGVLSDPDGYISMKADDILADLFGETNAITASAEQGGTISPYGTVRIKEGSTQSFVISPNNNYEVASVIVDGVDVTNQLVNNRYTFSNVNEPHTIQATFQPGEEWFIDVPAGMYYYDAVRWAVKNGITQGMSHTQFSPDENCTRAQIVTFLWRANKSPITADNNDISFTDVSDTAFYKNAVRWAVNEGITQGTSSTTFGPNETVTRGQAIAFLWRADGSPVVSDDSLFTDVPKDAFYFDAVQWAVNKGITQGTSSMTFSPGESCTRAQIMTFLHRVTEN